uniref:Calcineurin-like phosphoesterase domain-containing protein n=2 Tax=Physcomitrium patens TaxID=3218 RepID=A0A2K1KXM7_PHYPA|nr:hypothetical protein PHYPA_005540 [Physcomitrium patens]
MQEIWLAMPTLVHIIVLDTWHFIVYGDIHGHNSLPSKENHYLFISNFVDDGSFFVEIILTLFALKCLYPTYNN